MNKDFKVASGLAGTYLIGANVTLAPGGIGAFNARLRFTVGGLDTGIYVYLPGSVNGNIIIPLTGIYEVANNQEIKVLVTHDAAASKQVNILTTRGWLAKLPG